MRLLKKNLGFIKSQQACSQAPSGFQCREAARKSAKRFPIDVERLKILPIQLKVLPELNPVIAGSLLWLWHAVGRLRADMNFRLRGPVVFAFCLPNQNFSHCILNFDGVFSLRLDAGDFVGPCMLGGEIDLLAEHAILAVQDGDDGSWQRLIGIESGNECVAVACQD